MDAEVRAAATALVKRLPKEIAGRREAETALVKLRADVEALQAALAAEREMAAVRPEHDRVEIGKLQRRVSELEAEVLDGQQRAETMTVRLDESQRETRRALDRLRQEAEARDRAESDAAGGRRSRGDDRHEAMLTQVGTLEAVADAARADADRLADELLRARRDLERASDELKDEAEARMRAESRVAGLTGQ